MATGLPFRSRAAFAAAAAAGLAALPLLQALVALFRPGRNFEYWGYLPFAELWALMRLALGGFAGARVGVWLLATRAGGAGPGPFRVAFAACFGALGGLAFWAVAPSEGAHGPTYAASLAVAAAGAFLFALPFAGRAREAPPRRPRFCLAIGAAVLAFDLAPLLGAFPAHGTLAERDAWTRRHVHEYAGLAGLVAKAAPVVADVGAVTAIAPTGDGAHRVVQDMNGQGLRFTLEVVGPRGSGTFEADGLVMEGLVLDWRRGVWRFGGRAVDVSFPIWKPQE